MRMEWNQTARGETCYHGRISLLVDAQLLGGAVFLTLPE
jgi:hypothetical protein